MCIDEDIDILSGMNMSMVLELVIANHSKGLDIQQIIYSAKEGITLENKKLLNQKIEEEDF